MFGYVSVNPQALSEEEKQRFRAFYCGLCHTLEARYGNAGRLTLSNDMTFLSLLLYALYEPQKTTLHERCLLHPAKPHDAVLHAGAEYAADMNILLAYYKCADDAADDRSLRGRVGSRALAAPFEQVRQHWPRQCAQVAQALQQIERLEKTEQPDLDALVRAAGEMLGACFAWREDIFAPQLRQMGAALGRFIYLMDAYEDYARDAEKGRFNPLAALHGQPDYEARMEEILTMEMAQCAQAYDYLPIVQEDGLIRNILYSGVWGRYAALQQKGKGTKQ